MTRAELAWVDHLGFYIVYDTINAKQNTLQVAIPRWLLVLNWLWNVGLLF